MQCLLEGDPHHWQSNHVKSVFGYPDDTKLLPFMRFTARKLGLDLATLGGSGSTYVRITADAIDADDLRLAFGKIMSEMEVVPTSSPLYTPFEDVQPGADEGNATGATPREAPWLTPGRISQLRWGTPILAL
jgi:hypothetical protein